MDLLTAFLALVVGYALGSISFTRLIARQVVPQDDLSTTTFDMPGSDKQFVMTSVSATAIFARAGAKSGCLVVLFDALKASLPILLFQYLYPATPYYLLTAIGAVAGHNYPIQHRFKGGRGMSPLMGSMFAIDWLSVPVLFVLSNVLGFGVLRDAMGFYASSVLLGIPWMWYRFGDWPHILTAVILNLLFFSAMLPELRQYITFKRSGEFDKAAAHRATQAQSDPNEGLLMQYRRKFGLVKK